MTNKMLERFQLMKQPLINDDLPQRNFSHYVHVVDLRKIQGAWDGCGHHHLWRTNTIIRIFLNISHKYTKRNLSNSYMNWNRKIKECTSVYSENKQTVNHSQWWFPWEWGRAACGGNVHSAPSPQSERWRWSGRREARLRWCEGGRV